jgi:hypothetical protein
MASSNPYSNPDILACKIQGTNFMRRLTKLWLNTFENALYKLIPDATSELGLFQWTS